MGLTLVSTVPPVVVGDGLDALMARERVSLTPELKARLDEMTVDEREIYAEQLGLRVESDNPLLDAVESEQGRPFSTPIKPHDYFSESALGADTFMGRDGRFQRSLGKTGRALGVAAMIGGVFLPVAGTVLGASDAYADTVVPSAARLGGMYGSFWLTDLGVYNPFSIPVTVNIYATPRNQSEDPSASPLLTRVVAPHNTLLLADVEAALHGSTFSGVDRLRLTFEDNAGATVPNLKVTASTYNLAGPGEEFGTQQTVFDPATDYHATGTTLVAQLSKDGMRDGVLVMSGPDGATIEWTYRNGAGANETTVTGTYGPNQTFQYTSNVPQLIGFTPEASGSLEARITAGSARAALTHNNNTTNDPAWDQMSVKPADPIQPQPRIIGLDLDGDGIANVVDANGDGALDDTIGVSCSAPFDYQHTIIAETHARLPQR